MKRVEGEGKHGAVLLLLNWPGATPDRPFMSYKSLSQRCELVVVLHWHPGLLSLDSSYAGTLCTDDAGQCMWMQLI